MGFILTLFVVLHNDNLYKLVSSNSPDHIKVIIDLRPRYSLCDHFGREGKLFPVTTGLSHENCPACKRDCGACTLPKLTTAQEDSG